jgi:hypothetical protein
VVDTVLIESNTIVGNRNGMPPPEDAFFRLIWDFQGLRIKTYFDNYNASVSNVIYKDNTVTNA